MEHYWELPDDDSRKAHWLRSLLKIGLKPTQEILFEVPMWQWQVWEVTLIHWFRCLGFTVVNTSEGGDGLINPTDEVRAKCALGFKGRHHTAEAREKISAASRGRKMSTEARSKISAARQREKASGKKRVLSEQHKANIGSASRGKKLTEEHRRNMGLARKGKPFSAEHREKLRQSHLGIVYGPMSPEHKAKIAATKVGEKNPMFGKYGSANPMFHKNHTPETIAKISASQKKRLTILNISASLHSSL